MPEVCKRTVVNIELTGDEAKLLAEALYGKTKRNGESEEAKELRDCLFDQLKGYSDAKPTKGRRRKSGKDANSEDAAEGSSAEAKTPVVESPFDPVAA